MSAAPVLVRWLSLVLVLAGAGCAEAPPAPAARHLLLVSVDTLRADRLGFGGYARPTSPHLDALAERSAVFDRAYATSSWTLPSVASLLTSTYPSTHGASNDHTPLAPELETLAERLAREGFRTGAVTSHLYLDRRYGVDRGFEDFDNELVRSTRQESHRAVSSEAVTSKALAWLGARTQQEVPARWFLWLHYFDPHHLYVVHRGVSEAFGTEAGPDRYDGEIAFVDAQLGRLLEGLDRLGLRAETLVAIVADHGEEFGEHGGLMHRRTLFDEVMRVPLLIHGPGVAQRRIRRPVSAIDLAPTLLELLGVEAPEGFAGRSLVPLLEGSEVPPSEVVAELRNPGAESLEALVAGRWKLIVDRQSGQRRLFDLERDPLEQSDLAAAESERTRELEARLGGVLEEAAARGPGPGPAIELSSEDRQRLEELGYAPAQ